jgi:hypothetical protein
VPQLGYRLQAIGERAEVISCRGPEHKVMSPAAARYHDRVEAGELSAEVPQPQPHPSADFGRDRALPLAIFALTFAYLLLFRRYTAMEPDEGIILQGAQRILQGQVLYRDFFSFFTPGSYYLLALLFKIFGSSMMVARTKLAVEGGFFSVFTYLMARRVCARWSALLTAYLVTITCLPWRFLTLHNWDSTLWACGAIYCAVRWVETMTDAPLTRLGPLATLSPGERAEQKMTQPALSRKGGKAEAAQSFPSSGTLRFFHVFRFRQKSRRPPKARGLRYPVLSSLSFWAFATGSLIAITVLFEQSKGTGLALGVCVGFAILFFVPGQRSMRFGRGCWIALGAGFVWPFVITFGYFGLQHALPALWADWVWPLHHYTSANTVPYGYQEWSSFAPKEMLHSGLLTQQILTLVTLSPSFLLPVLPIIAVVLLVHWGLASRRGTLAPDRAAYYILVCCSVGGLLLSVMVVRANVIHFVYLIPTLYLVLAWLVDGADIHSGFVNSMRPVLLICICIVFTALGMAFLVRNRNGRWWMETRRGTVYTPAPDTVLSYTQAHAPAGSSILVYPYLPLYYYLTATYSPTGFDYLQPGMHTREQDEEAIREVETDRTRFVLFEPGFNQKIAASWPNTPLRSIAIDPVGDYILAHYHPCAVLHSAARWRFLFMVRKGLSCPR